MALPSFQGLRVLSFESRRATEVSALITTYGGDPRVVPILKEVPIEANPAATTFGEQVRRGEFDVVMFLTGVGARILVDAIRAASTAQAFDAFLAALAKTKIVARGPKPMAVLRELSLPVWLAADEPNTWREILAGFETKGLPLSGARIAVQEYGVPNHELLDALAAGGASVTTVPVYQWAMPDDLTPVEETVRAICRGEVDVLIVTSGVQLVHLWRVAEPMGLDGEMREGLARSVIASIGPAASDEIRRRGLVPDLEASRPKMGMLVREAAEQSPAILSATR